MPRVIIVGAGPAGATAALTLARGRGGIETLLLERRALPRPKTCAGGLSPWTLALLGRLGLRERVEAEAHAIRGALLFNRHGEAVALRGRHRAAVLPRARFDALLVEEACRAGATLREGARVRALLLERGRARGVVLEGGETLEADAVVLATGAAPLGRAARREEERFFGILARYEGMRGVADELELYLEEEIRPHYAWVFPEGEERANVGLCFRRGARGPSAHLLFETFLERRLAGRLRDATRVGRVVAQPIDASVWPRPERLAAPGLLRVGEAAGLVDAVSGEGIYHALESGLLAAASLLEGGSAPEARYARAVQRALGPRLALGGALDLVGRTPLFPLVGGLIGVAPVRRAFESLFARS